MESESNFQDLLARAQAGDNDAVQELFDTYKDVIRRAARTRMFHASQQRVFDSEDILQTVMKSFFMRVGRPGNQWKLESSADLVNLLMTMAKNKTVNVLRKLETDKRGGNFESLPIDEVVPTSSDFGPSEQAEINELATLCWDRLPVEIRGLYEMRYDKKMSWDEIGEWLGDTPDSCRKRLKRSLEDIAKQFRDQ